MRRLKLSDRVRAYVQRRMRERPRGAWADLVRYLAHSPVAHKKLKSPSVSMMFSSGTRGVDLDTLDDVAAFLSVPLSEVLGIPNTSDLSADEQRIVLAFRALPSVSQVHILAIAEQLSVSARIMGSRRDTPGQKRVHGDETLALPATTADRLSALAHEFTERVNAVVITDARRQAPPPRAEVAETRPVHRVVGRSDVEKP